MCGDARDPVGLYVGTTSGEIWASRDEGAKLEMHRAAPAGDLCAGDGGAVALRVTIPSPLISYTSRREVSADGATLAEVLVDLERQFPGIRFRMIDEQDRIRTHMRFFLGGEELRDLDSPLDAHATLHIVQALSGG